LILEAISAKLLGVSLLLKKPPVITTLASYDSWLRSETLTSISPQSSHAVTRPDGYIKRPPNAFIIFRQHCVRALARSSLNQQSMSSETGRLWHSLPQSWRDRYSEIFKVIRAEHENTHPEYQFRPDRSRVIRRRRTKKLQQTGLTTDLPENIETKFRAHSEGKSVVNRAEVQTIPISAPPERCGDKGLRSSIADTSYDKATGEEVARRATSLPATTSHLYGRELIWSASAAQDCDTQDARELRNVEKFFRSGGINASPAHTSL
jgi:hypothetical protein